LTCSYVITEAIELMNHHAVISTTQVAIYYR